MANRDRSLPWVVIAVRPNDDRFVLTEATTRRAALALANRFRRHLTDVKDVRVEFIGLSEVANHERGE